MLSSSDPKVHPLLDHSFNSIDSSDNFKGRIPEVADNGIGDKL
jgi:hypothetical protein